MFKDLRQQLCACEVCELLRAIVADATLPKREHAAVPSQARSKNAERCRRYRDKRRSERVVAVATASPDHVAKHVATCPPDMGGAGGGFAGQDLQKEPERLGLSEKEDLCQVENPGGARHGRDMVGDMPSERPSAIIRIARAGNFGMEAQQWADGVRSRTGARPDIPNRAWKKLEEFAAERPDQAVDPMDFMFADGIRFADECKRAGRWKVTVWVYIDWVGGGRQPMVTAARARPVQSAAGRAYKIPEGFDD